MEALCLLGMMMLSKKSIERLSKVKNKKIKELIDKTENEAGNVLLDGGFLE